MATESSYRFQRESSSQVHSSRVGVSGYQGLGNARLNYKVVDASSEDPASQAQTIQTDYSVGIQNTNGWKSRKFCDYPQTISLQFEMPMRIKTLQFLCHETMISSRVEINFLPSDAVSTK